MLQTKNKERIPSKDKVILSKQILKCVLKNIFKILPGVVKKLKVEKSSIYFIYTLYKQLSVHTRRNVHIQKL